MTIRPPSRHDFSKPWPIARFHVIRGADLIGIISRQLVRPWIYLWALPTTIVGLTAGLLTLAKGGRVQSRQGALEFHGGFARWLLERKVINASAMTLGHVIIGRDAECLADCRDHEQAHVRQVERWGPFFLPAYAIASVWAWKQGGHYYFDNAFECDARRQCGEDLVT